MLTPIKQYLTNTGINVFEAALSRWDKKIARFYESGASKKRITLYLLALWIGLAMYSEAASSCYIQGVLNDWTVVNQDCDEKTLKAFEMQKFIKMSPSTMVTLKSIGNTEVHFDFLKIKTGKKLPHEVVIDGVKYYRK